jgi:rhodanese-related sulfurtransferase/energy-converting hydrogenase Eha subunit A
MRTFIFATLVVLLFCCGYSAFCFCADEALIPPQEQEACPATEPKRKESSKDTLYAPYCGVHAVYIVANGLGRKVDISEVVLPQYISSRSGSSVEDLQYLCKKLGLQSRLFTRMTISSLKGLTGCSILHVASHAGSSKYDHWILCTGVKDGSANVMEVIDGGIVSRSISLDHLAVSWDGVALLVCADTSTDIYYLLFVWVERLLVIASLAVLTFIIATANFPIRLPLMSQANPLKIFFESAVIFLTGLILFGAYVLFFCPIGYMPNSSVKSKIENDKYLTFLPKVSTRQVEKMLLDDKTTIVDARHPSQFQEGHIDSSINVTVLITQKETERLLRSIPKDNKIIMVYEPYPCAGAIDVFRRVNATGHQNLYRYEFGWDKWNKEHKR